MSRGIHLKQLTETDLGLLGLPGEAIPAAQRASAHQEVPDRAAEPSSDPPALAGRAAPPSNPANAPLAAAKAMESESGEAPDLIALTREIREGLEDTLRLLAPR